MPTLVGAVAIRVPLAEQSQVCFRFPLIPTGFLFSDNEKVRSVEHAHSLSGGTFIVQLDCRRLVKILQDSGVVLHFVDAGQFDSMAFELDGHAHFPAGIAPGNVRLAPSPHGVKGPTSECGL